MIMKSHKKISENYLERIPLLRSDICCKEEDGVITLEIENKGLMNRIAQKLFFKPAVSYIHLDKLGSFSVKSADGERDIIAIGKLVSAEFGDEAEPLYERLAKFFQIMDSYGFVDWK